MNSLRHTNPLLRCWEKKSRICALIVCGTMALTAGCGGDSAAERQYVAEVDQRGLRCETDGFCLITQSDENYDGGYRDADHEIHFHIERSNREFLEVLKGAGRYQGWIRDEANNSLPVTPVYEPVGTKFLAFLNSSDYADRKDERGKELRRLVFLHMQTYEDLARINASYRGN